MADYQSQLTDIYNQLNDIQATLAKLALLSRVNTMQGILQDELDSLTARIATCEGSLSQMQLTMGDILTEMKNL